MGIIRVLPDELVGKIAAGEVVERPSSVVKELSENSIDAGCEEITIEVQNGGKTLIQVADDGVGMSPEDALLAVRRYATSKIEKIEDLSSIGTMGFRGEALPSILSCCRFELRTKARGALAGYSLRGEGGEIGEHGELGMPEGTVVSVKDLFFNLPARKKFLRATSTEFGHVQDEVINLALAHPKVRMRLIHNGKTLFDLAGVETREERIRSLFGPEIVNDGYRVEFNSYPISVEGWMGESTGLHARSDVFLFVNRRRVRNRNLLHALYQAYRNSFMERHPLILLFMEIVPSLVDVNIHPRKSEVRFSDERNVHQLVASKVAEVLRAGGSVPRSTDVYADVLPEIAGLTDLPQLHNTYILVEVADGFILIDQHAAHERVLMERVEEQEIGLGSQKLLFPITLELSRGLSETLLKHQNLVRELGFLVEGFGGNTHRISSIPSVCRSSDPKALLVETLQELSSLGRVREPRKELLKIVACKAAIKAGQPLSDAEKRRLIEDLCSCRHPHECPHGRPTMVRVSTEELNRRFGRS